MGRNNFGVSIDRLISTYSALLKQHKRKRLIKENYDLKKECPPEYRISDINFNKQNRNTKITFLCTQQYRTIVRYVTQNYQRYPIYSSWKTRQKTINKSIKLTNSTLENLNSSTDDLIRNFAEEIILSLNCDDLIPSWLTKKVLYQDLVNQIRTQEKKINSIQNNTKNFVYDQNHKQNQIKNEVTNLEKVKFNLNKKILRKDRQLTKITNFKHSFLINLVTFFIYALCTSSKRKMRLQKKETNFHD